jgi:hypothetical protein
MTEVSIFDNRKDGKSRRVQNICLKASHLSGDFIYHHYIIDKFRTRMLQGWKIKKVWREIPLLKYMEGRRLK